MISAGGDGTTGAPEGAPAVAEDGISGTDPVGAPPLGGMLAALLAEVGPPDELTLTKRLLGARRI